MKRIITYGTMLISISLTLLWVFGGPFFWMKKLDNDWLNKTKALYHATKVEGVTEEQFFAIHSGYFWHRLGDWLYEGYQTPTRELVPVILLFVFGFAFGVYLLDSATKSASNKFIRVFGEIWLSLAGLYCLVTLLFNGMGSLDFNTP